ncbi:MAG TPA: Asp-tRNA(Asn)/Glu-tRNA(Gln) amidotransferase subunit GatA [Vicinamibacterales bacterium]|nr:Asp-tRNA(Asn)/Glu-tRNA(Gln) amidotransferase subunit GatA [Vicinamibacterales bacterium]
MIPPDAASAITAAVMAGDLKAADLCRSTLARIADANPELHAFHDVSASAVARAETVDRRPTGPLAGVPIARKDNICAAGELTTAGSRLLERYRPPYDATVVERLTSAGAVLVGTTICDEFAMGSSTENGAFGPARNPWALDRTPGGSSGGSAAAVAAGLVPVALGSDTGGSIRQPAAMCGVVGLKPTYGRVSRYGLIAFASSLDQIGPITRTVRDAALVLGVIAGRDPMDATSADVPVPDYTGALTGEVRGTRIAVPWHLLEEGVDAEVREAFTAALDTLRGQGAELVDVRLPHAPLAVPVYYLVATAEASSNLARYDGVRYGRRVEAPSPDAMYAKTREQGFGAEVKRRIMLGTYVLSAGYFDAYYLKAQQVRTLIRRDFEHAFSAGADVVALPTSPTAAFPLGERVDDPLRMYVADVFTASANLAGLPAISLPCGLTRDRLPVGLQLTGRAFDEATLLRIGDAFERATPWARERPPHWWAPTLARE